jgi:hypothetical protein
MARNPFLKILHLEFPFSAHTNSGQLASRGQTLQARVGEEPFRNLFGR